MTRFEIVTGIAGFAIMAGIGIWVAVMRNVRKRELTTQQRKLSGMGLAVALALFFIAMPAVLWVKIIGYVLAAAMFVSSLYQWNPKLPERRRAVKDEPAKRRSAADAYMPYYKRKQQKQKRSK
ncbi:MAG: hypothetical protein ACM3XN_04320 [Chloroflexota bacterium]